MRTAEVKIGDRTLTVRELSWANWKAVRRALAEATAKEALPAVVTKLVRLWPVLSGETDPAVAFGSEAGGKLLDELAGIVGGAARDLCDSLDSITDLLIELCVVSDVDPDMSASAVIALRDAVLSHVDLPGLLGAEKNSVLAVLNRRAASGSKTTSAPSGTRS